MTFLCRLVVVSSLITSPVSAQLRHIENIAFRVGERLTFSIGWEFISAGTATLAVESTVQERMRPSYKVFALTESNAFFSRLYRVRDTLISYIDAEGIYPLRYIKHTNEGSYSRNFEVVFNQESRAAVINDQDSGRREIQVPVFTQDILSAFYFIRTLPLEAGKDVSVPVFDNGKYSTVTVRVVKKEKVNVTAGSFDCIVVRTPIGPFENRSDLFIWLTDDDRRIPVLMKSKILIGSVKAELERMSGI
ncbi:MAG: DUF3108 domain-containing protein [Bacteroidetes bacterium]|nr:DUF3108 domain-containing protein [Bacteroidota bacterium]